MLAKTQSLMPGQTSTSCIFSLRFTCELKTNYPHLLIAIHSFPRSMDTTHGHPKSSSANHPGDQLGMLSKLQPFSTQELNTPLSLVKCIERLRRIHTLLIPLLYTANLDLDEPAQFVNLQLQKFLWLSIKALELAALHSNALTFNKRQHAAVHFIGKYQYAYHISVVIYIWHATQLSFRKHICKGMGSHFYLTSKLLFILSYCLK